MKVKKLIETLKSYPEDLEVLTWDCEYGYNDIDEVRLLTVEKGMNYPDKEDTVNEYSVDTDVVKVGQQFIALK